MAQLESMHAVGGGPRTRGRIKQNAAWHNGAWEAKMLDWIWLLAFYTAAALLAAARRKHGRTETATGQELARSRQKGRR
jgi:hypothetical protein